MRRKNEESHMAEEDCITRFKVCTASYYYYNILNNKSLKTIRAGSAS